MTGAFNGLGYFALVFQAGTGQATGQNFALFVKQFQQEVAVFVVDVLDPGFLEAVVLLTILSI